MREEKQQALVFLSSFQNELKRASKETKIDRVQDIVLATSLIVGALKVAVSKSMPE